MGWNVHQKTRIVVQRTLAEGAVERSTARKLLVLHLVATIGQQTIVLLERGPVAELLVTTAAVLLKTIWEVTI